MRQAVASKDLDKPAAASVGRVFTLPEVPKEWQDRVDRNSSVPEAIYHATAGIRSAWRSERILKLHVSGCVTFFIIAAFCEFDSLRWAVTIMAAGMLIASELVNTAVERIADMTAGHQFHQLAREAKDIAAGAVLCCVIASITLGTMLILSTPKAQSALSIVLNSGR